MLRVGIAPPCKACFSKRSARCTALAHRAAPARQCEESAPLRRKAVPSGASRFPTAFGPFACGCRTWLHARCPYLSTRPRATHASSADGGPGTANPEGPGRNRGKAVEYAGRWRSRDRDRGDDLEDEDIESLAFSGGMADA